MISIIRNYIFSCFKSPFPIIFLWNQTLNLNFLNSKPKNLPFPQHYQQAKTDFNLLFNKNNNKTWRKHKKNSNITNNRKTSSKTLLFVCLITMYNSRKNKLKWYQNKLYLKEEKFLMNGTISFYSQLSMYSSVQKRDSKTCKKKSKIISITSIFLITITYPAVLHKALPLTPPNLAS